MASASGMFDEITPRQREIVQIVGDKGFATIDALAQHFAVSAQSIRRDIIQLDEGRYLQRFHGGAGLRDSTVRLGYAEKHGRSTEGKARIAAAAVALVPDGASVFLDVGTTVEAVDAMRKGLYGIGKGYAAQVNNQQRAAEMKATTEKGMSEMEAYYAKHGRCVDDLKSIAKMLRRLPVAELETPTVALVGAPNVGKSSLCRRCPAASRRSTTIRSRPRG